MLLYTYHYVIIMLCMYIYIYIYIYREASITCGFNHMTNMILHYPFSRIPGAKASITWSARRRNHMWTPMLQSHADGGPDSSPPKVQHYVTLPLLQMARRQGLNHMNRQKLWSHADANASTTRSANSFNHMRPHRTSCDWSFPVEDFS